jgi:hypothetical protein
MLPRDKIKTSTQSAGNQPEKLSLPVLQGKTQPRLRNKFGWIFDYSSRKNQSGCLHGQQTETRGGQAGPDKFRKERLNHLSRSDATCMTAPLHRNHSETD